MKLNIDYNNKTITLPESVNLEEFFDKVKVILGNESGNWESWTLKQEVKIPQKEIVYKENPLSQPYNPFGNPPILTFDSDSKFLPKMSNISFNTEPLKEESLKSNTYSHT